MHGQSCTVSLLRKLGDFTLKSVQELVVVTWNILMEGDFHCMHRYLMPPPYPLVLNGLSKNPSLEILRFHLGLLVSGLGGTSNAGSISCQCC